MRTSLSRVVAFTGTALGSLSVDFDSSSSIRTAAALKAQDVMSFYHGNEEGQIPGILPGPPPNGLYFWWQAGALWGTMIDYWRYTGDAQYNHVTKESLLFQVGPDQNYLPPNITASVGNDDQSFWGMSAMLAAETGFQNPPSSEPQWLSLAQAVYNTQKGHLDEETACGGGLRWQVIVLNNGYNYKNAIANGGFFNIAARLARYTGDEDYAKYAKSMFQWMKNVGFIDQDYNVWDGAHVETDCKDINHAQFSYTAAVILQGAAFMWDFTKDQYWKLEVNRFLHSILEDFFPDGVFFEPACEGTLNVPKGGCTQDMKSFRGFVMRWLAETAQLCPWTRERIMTAIKSSAEAAVQTCTGGENGRMCGMRWGMREFDGDVNLGQEMGVLSALMTMLLLEDGSETYEDHDGYSSYSEPVDSDTTSDEPANEPALHSGHADASGGGIKPPLTHDTGGTSVGDPHAGQSRRKTPETKPIQDTDTIMTIVLTTAVMMCGIVMFVWMGIDGLDPRKRHRPRNGHRLEDIELQPMALKAYDRHQTKTKSRKHDRYANTHKNTTAAFLDSRSEPGPQVKVRPARPRDTRLCPPWVHHKHSIKRARWAASECLRSGTRLSIERQRFAGQRYGRSDTRSSVMRVGGTGDVWKRSLKYAGERHYTHFEGIGRRGGKVKTHVDNKTKRKPDGRLRVHSHRSRN